jgi:dipeptidyl aminopeptidase/acylaminoacyl peptidase
MFVDFDVNEKSNVICILQFLRDGTKQITTYDLKTKKLIGVIGNEYLPLGPRLSPAKNLLAFFSKSNPLYLWDKKTNNVKSFFDHPFLNAGFCEWSSLGKQICFSAYSTDPKKKTPPDIYVMNLENTEVIKLTDDNDCVDRFPQWSPSNQFIAFHRQYLYEPNIPKKIYIVDAKTKVCNKIPHSQDTNHHIGRYCWSEDSAHLIVKEVSNDGVLLKVFRTFDMALEWTFECPEIVGGVFLNNKHILVVCRKELLIVTFPVGDIVQKLRIPNNIPVQETLRGPSISLGYKSNNIYFLNEDSCLYRVNKEGSFELLFQNSEEQLPVFTHQEYMVKSKDGYTIPVHTFLPENPKKMGILFVHGGPGQKVDDPKEPLITRFLAEGYEVVVPAYRGCAGYGEEHRQANTGEYGRADVWDVLATGFDWKIKTHYKRPLAIIGYSYGGYLTFLSISSHDNPWDCGITLWGVTRIEHMKLHLPKAYPSDPKEIRIAQRDRNPLEQASKIMIPLLILHGEKDTTSITEEVKCIQRQMLNHGSACEVIVYNDTHGLEKHRRDMFEQIFSFLEK